MLKVGLERIKLISSICMLDQSIVLLKKYSKILLLTMWNAQYLTCTSYLKYNEAGKNKHNQEKNKSIETDPEMTADGIRKQVC